MRNRAVAADSRRGGVWQERKDRNATGRRSAAVSSGVNDGGASTARPYSAPIKRPSPRASALPSRSGTSAALKARTCIYLPLLDRNSLVPNGDPKKVALEPSLHLHLLGCSKPQESKAASQAAVRKSSFIKVREVASEVSETG